MQFVLIEKEEKLDQSIEGEICLVFGEGDKGQNERVLLLYLVDYYVLAPGLAELVVEDASRDRSEQEHVQENENDEVNRVRLVVLHCQDLVVGVVVIRRQGVGLENHHAEVVVVWVVLVETVDRVGLGVARVEGQHLGPDQRKTKDNDRIVNDEDDEIFIGWEEGDEGFFNLWVENCWKD